MYFCTASVVREEVVDLAEVAVINGTTTHPVVVVVERGWGVLVLQAVRMGRETTSRLPLPMLL